MYMDEEETNIVTQRGRRLTKQLFHEMWVGLPEEGRTHSPKFTLHRDKPGLINFGREYIQYGDMTGYKMANKYLEDYYHWNLLMKANWFKEAKAIWDEEIEARLHAESMETLLAIAKGEGPQAIQAAKFIATKGYKDKQALSKRGRPTKDQLEGQIKRELEDAKVISNDAARILKVVQ